MPEACRGFLSTHYSIGMQLLFGDGFAAAFTGRGFWYISSMGGLG
jgi:hypothetical protein